jgi:hypothetical protein
LLNSLDGKGLGKGEGGWKRLARGVEDLQLEELPDCGLELPKAHLLVVDTPNSLLATRSIEEQRTGGQYSPQKEVFAISDNHKVTQLFVSAPGHESSSLGDVDCLAEAVKQPHCPL